ncbi:hypothetical protein, partial [Anaerostipes hadrus]|uniref:hypothetical protein n=1 Tax=Anaerostipes hadrus TaxID=649756 RepID=UPI001EDF1768
LFDEALYNARKYLELDPFGEYREEAEELIYILNAEKEDETGSFSYEQDELMGRQEEARQYLEAGHFEMA